jgi:hypothetical protein
VEVNVEAKSAGDALDEGHRSGAREPSAEAACPTALPGEDRAQCDGVRIPAMVITETGPT